VGVLLVLIALFDFSIQVASAETYKSFFLKYSHLTFSPIDCLSMIVAGLILMVGIIDRDWKMWVHTIGGAALISFNSARVIWELLVEGGNNGAVPIAIFGTFGTWVVIRLMFPKRPLTLMLPYVMMFTSLVIFFIDFAHYASIALVSGYSATAPHSLFVCILLFCIGLVAKHYNETLLSDGRVNAA
jgi:hypothetical protein